MEAAHLAGRLRETTKRQFNFGMVLCQRRDSSRKLEGARLFCVHMTSSGEAGFYKCRNFLEKAFCRVNIFIYTFSSMFETLVAISLCMKDAFLLFLPS